MAGATQRNDCTGNRRMEPMRFDLMLTPSSEPVATRRELPAVAVLIVHHAVLKAFGVEVERVVARERKLEVGLLAHLDQPIAQEAAGRVGGVVLAQESRTEVMEVLDTRGSTAPATPQRPSLVAGWAMDDVDGRAASSPEQPSADCHRRDRNGKGAKRRNRVISTPP